MLIVLPINSPSAKINRIYFLNIRLDHLIHLLLFFPWMWLIGFVRKPSGAAKWVMIGLVFAVISELIQILQPYRSFNLNDLIANCLGIILGLFVFLLMKKFYK